MQTIIIEWLHLDVAGKTCRRCGDTGKELRRAVERLQVECMPKGIVIGFKETLLNPEQIARSNTILINGVPLEEIVPQTRVSSSCCTSCGEITGQTEQCRTLVHLGQEHETIPEKLIRKAVCQVGGCC